MEKLNKHLKILTQNLSLQDRKKLKNRLEDLISVYPFNEYEYIISHLYDLMYKLTDKKMIKIEVKASRAVDFNSPDPLYIKALAWKSKKMYDMNFQQVKPKCCDVFVWIGVWRDVIKYWVLSSKEVKKNKYYSKGQHRGNIGEGQLHLKYDNIREFEKYSSKPRELFDKIISAYERQKFS